MNIVDAPPTLDQMALAAVVAADTDAASLVGTVQKQDQKDCGDDAEEEVEVEEGVDKENCGGGSGTDPNQRQLPIITKTTTTTSYNLDQALEHKSMVKETEEDEVVDLLITQDPGQPDVNNNSPPSPILLKNIGSCEQTHASSSSFENQVTPSATPVETASSSPLVPSSAVVVDTVAAKKYWDDKENFDHVNSIFVNDSNTPMRSKKKKSKRSLALKSPNVFLPSPLADITEAFSPQQMSSLSFPTSASLSSSSESVSNYSVSV